MIYCSSELSILYFEILSFYLTPENRRLNFDIKRARKYAKLRYPVYLAAPHLISSIRNRFCVITVVEIARKMQVIASLNGFYSRLDNLHNAYLVGSLSSMIHRTIKKKLDDRKGNIKTLK